MIKAPRLFPFAEGLGEFDMDAAAALAEPGAPPPPEAKGGGLLPAPAPSSSPSGAAQLTAAASADPVDGKPSSPLSGPSATRSAVFPQPDEPEVGGLAGEAGLGAVELAREAAAAAPAAAAASAQAAAAAAAPAAQAAAAAEEETEEAAGEEAAVEERDEVCLREHLPCTRHQIWCAYAAVFAGAGNGEAAIERDGG
jgi:hypothetical protein